MNPKSVNDLDPKLKETYERVMGTSVPAAQVPKMETQPVASTPPVENKMSEAAAPTENTTVSQVFKAGSPFKETEPPPADLLVKASDTVKVGKKNKLPLPILIMLGVIIFFAAYAVIWAKVLGLF
jgi:hypothetical protein